MNEKNYLLRFTRGIRILNEMTFPYRFKGDSVLGKQDRMLCDMLSYAIKHCEYYRNLNINELKLSRFPLLTKQTIQNNYNSLISDEKDHFIYWDAYTGGTTGEPMHFLQQSCIDLPYQLMLWRRMGYKRGDVVIAMTGTEVPQEDLANNIYWVEEGGKDIPYGRAELSSFYYNETRAPHYVDYLNNLKPAFIRGYPSFVYEFSKYLVEKGITLGFSPKAIQLTSEPSYEYQYEMIRRAFHIDTIYLQYGHTESSVFGYTYDNSFEYIIEPLYGVTEILDEEGNEVAVGQSGEIVVTSLYNRVMPLIRYKTGDIAVKGETIDGKLHLKQIIGRTWDHIIDRDNNKVIDPMIFEDVAALASIAKWQIEQTEAGKITMHIVKGKQYSSKDEDEMRDIFDRIANVDVEFDYVDSIPGTARGKHKMIVQHLKS
ncbi:MAG: phenylacetate--CoA ligase family protein [Lachnospiraceae bacterium]|nr:phenylacetate--CoA ligase family protein [Lachnospiraceae bacterium]